jgi:UDP-N-acetylmuramoyl-tripeptide--D-alanyl-D-alanine ligase
VIAVSTPTTFDLNQLAAATGGRVVAGRAERQVNGVSIDTRTLKQGELFVAVAGARFDGHDFLGSAASRGAAAALVHKDVVAPPGLDVVRVDDTTRALGDLARHVRMNLGLPVLAITGSTGKTTTKDMSAALLESRGPVLKTEANLNNRYGVPLTLFRLRPEHTAVVLEMGMSAAGELSGLTRIARPDVAVITNVAAVHLEFFDSVDAIARAKAEILEGLRPFGAAVLNWDDPRTRKIGQDHKGDVVWFGRDRVCDVSAENLRGTVHGMRFELRIEDKRHDVFLPLPGLHFVQNFLAAAASAHRLGVTAEQIAERASELKAANRRGQVSRLEQGITLLDDSYNSNPVAVQAAVQALQMAAQGRRVAFLGDMLELGPEAGRLHEETGAGVAGALDALVGVGTQSASLIKGAGKAGLGKEALFWFADAAQAAAAAPEIVKPGDAVLVKGSRGVRMEQVAEALVARFGRLEE